MICPFCRQSDIQDNPGKTVCPSCNTGSKIDDQCECVFVGTEQLKMPMFGQVCTACGVVQQDKRDSCVWCGIKFNKTVH